MAPYLFIFFVEGMSSYLAATKCGIQGICLPNSFEDMLDLEFANNATLYQHLEVICLGLGQG